MPHGKRNSLDEGGRERDPPGGTICWPAIWARFAADAPHRPALGNLILFYSVHSGNSRIVFLDLLRRSADSTGSLLAHLRNVPLDPGTLGSAGPLAMLRLRRLSRAPYIHLRPSDLSQ